MKIRFIWVLFALVLSCAAKEATVGGRVRFGYDEARWQQQPVGIPGADVVRLADDEGDFTILVMPEKAVAGGMASAESRRKFVEGLSRTNAKTEDVKPIEIFGRSGFEFVGKRELNGVTLHMRIVLLVDEGDVLIVVSSAPGRDPMAATSISTVWKSVAVIKNAQPVASNADSWHVGCGAAFGASCRRGSSVTLGKKGFSCVR